MALSSRTEVAHRSFFCYYGVSGSSKSIDSRTVINLYTYIQKAMLVYQTILRPF